MSQGKLPTGWDEEMVRRVLEHYEEQSEEDAVLDEAGIESCETVMNVPHDLVAKAARLKILITGWRAGFRLPDGLNDGRRAPTIRAFFWAKFDGALWQESESTSLRVSDTAAVSAFTVKWSFSRPTD